MFFYCFALHDFSSIFLPCLNFIFSCKWFNVFIIILCSIDPVPQAETIYQAFDKKKQQPEDIPFNPYENKDSDDSHDSDKGQESKKPVPKKKVPQKPQKTERELLEEALKQVKLCLDLLLNTRL